MLSPDTPVEVHEERITGVISRNYRKEVSRGREPVYLRTPLEDLLLAEEGDEDEREKMLGQVLDYFFADGPHPGAVLRRVFALAKAVRPGLVLNMSLADLGMLFGETRAAACFRVRRIFNGYLKKQTGHDVRLHWQKSTEAVEKYKKAAKGNNNRRSGHALKN